MSTSALPTMTTLLTSADPGPYRMTVDEFERIAEGLDKPVELVDGVLVERTDMDPPHVLITLRLRRRLDRMIPEGWHARDEKPLRIPAFNERFPDVAVVRGEPEAYGKRHPGPEDIAVLIEVAVSTIRRDRGEKQTLYAASGIPVYWIVNLNNRQVEVYTGPGPDGYASREDFREVQSVPVVIEGVEMGRIAVADILPPPEPAAESDGA
jgi:Uma2 family endonuclease